MIFGAKQRTMSLLLNYRGEMVSELVNVLVSRKKFEKYVVDIDVKLRLADLSRIGKFVRVKSNFKVISEDPDDDIIVRTAYDGKADYIVSGDRTLLTLKEFKGIKILTIDEMLSVLNS